MTKEELTDVLDKHGKWAHGEARGTRADLSGANLSGAYLSGANLSGAYLSGAYLSGANLRSAYLRSANLRSAYLSGADLTKTILEHINWLAYMGITPNHRGIAHAYKLINSQGVGPFNGGINYLEGKTFRVEDVNRDIHVHCGAGINLATFEWCLREKQDGYRLLLMEFKAADAICPMGSDGKFRVKKCRKIGECDWHGNLLRDEKHG